MKNQNSTMTSLKILFIVLGALFGGIIFVFLPGQLGIMSPDKWYDDPLILLIIGVVVGGSLGGLIITLIKPRSKMI